MKDESREKEYSTNGDEDDVGGGWVDVDDMTTLPAAAAVALGKGWRHQFDHHTLGPSSVSVAGLLAPLLVARPEPAATSEEDKQEKEEGEKEERLLRVGRQECCRTRQALA